MSMPVKRKVPREPRYIAAYLILILIVVALRFVYVANRTAISDYLLDRVGLAGVVVGGVFVFLLILWLAKRLDDKQRE
jgi:hypothetical protein